MAVTLCTNLGNLKLELACQETPKTCKNFLALCASGYYDGCKFHRSVRNFAIQGGDPSGTGKGGESIYSTKYFEDELVPSLKHNQRGIVSMANRNKPNTNGSQFFITYARQPHLNGSCTVFGKVIHGFETLERMEKEPVGPKDRPINDIVIERVVIHANPFAEEGEDL